MSAEHKEAKETKDLQTRFKVALDSIMQQPESERSSGAWRFLGSMEWMVESNRPLSKKRIVEALERAGRKAPEQTSTAASA